MPLPPLPDNNTAVYYVDYSYQDRSHTMQFRTTLSTPATLIPIVEDFLDALTPVMDNTWAVLGARFRATGSIITLPAIAPVIDTGVGGTVNATRKPRQLLWPGRGGLSGRQTAVSVFGLNVADAGDFRYQPGEIPELDNARAVLQAAPANVMTTIGGDQASWYPYVNMNFNSYWERRARG